MRKPRSPGDDDDDDDERESLVAGGGVSNREPQRHAIRDWTWYLGVVAVVVVWCVCASESMATPIAAATLQHASDVPSYQQTQLHRVIKLAAELEHTALKNRTLELTASPPANTHEQHQPQQLRGTEDESHPTVEAVTPTPTPAPTPAEQALNITSVKIPRIIHQMWKTSTQIPSRFQPWIRSWVDKHPGWQYVFWTFEDQVALFEQLYPKYLPIIHNLTMVSVSDMARYAALHYFGGLYVDLDFECLKPFDQLHHDNDAFLSYEPGPHAVLLENAKGPAICNALLASAPGHPFWLQVLDNIYDAWLKGASVKYPINLTGPHMVKSTYETYAQENSDVRLYPPEFFYPEVAYWNMDKMRKACADRAAEPEVQSVCAWMDAHPSGEFTNNTHATHHWQCTWCRGDGESTHVTLAEVMRVPSGSDLIVFKPEFYLDAGTNKSRLAFNDLSQPTSL
ncbi:hypothetical protein P43SY_009682 [Pythium insidiosum]|uniref:Uncharacterized protein n=1 Tax=Pythium insidiosum TaxID=114742 RepID=A0AAD5M001_PYTIN|nr:hypothetical protein P43SY_009682 [Pythium insidiosum]